MNSSEWHILHRFERDESWYEIVRDTDAFIDMEDRDNVKGFTNCGSSLRFKTKQKAEKALALFRELIELSYV